jgi:hypothetical protein
VFGFPPTVTNLISVILFSPQNLFKYALRNGAIGYLGNDGVLINTVVELYGTQYILPFGARHAPYHLFVSLLNPVIVVVSAVSVSGSIINTVVEL